MSSISLIALITSLVLMALFLVFFRRSADAASRNGAAWSALACVLVFLTISLTILSELQALDLTLITMMVGILAAVSCVAGIFRFTAGVLELGSVSAEVIERLRTEVEDLHALKKSFESTMSDIDDLSSVSELPILICGKERIVFCNQSAVALLEVERELDLKGKHVLDFSGEQAEGDARQLITQWRRKLKSIGVFAFEWRFVTANNRDFTCTVVLSPCFYQGEELLKLECLKTVDQIRMNQSCSTELLRYQVAVDAVDIAFCEWNYGGKIRFYSPSFPELVGFKEEELGSVEHFDVWFLGNVASEKVEEVKYRLEKLSNMTTEPFSLQFHFKSGKGYWLYLEMTVRTHLIDGEYRILAVFSDVTYQYRQGQALRKLSTAVQRSSNATLLLDENACVEYVNSAFAKLASVTEISMVGISLDELLAGVVWPKQRKKLVTAVKSGKSWANELKLRFPKGRNRWCKLIALPVEAENSEQGVHYVITLEDVTKEREKRTALTKQAQSDPLTEVGNRTAFTESLDKVIESADQNEGFLGALLFIDLDEFKPVNDKYGHVVGDELLKEVARRLKRTVRHLDLVARLGGDEFTVLLTELASEDEASEVAHRILKEMEKPLVYQNKPVPIRLSIGMAYLPKDGKTAEEVIQCADKAMYQAKKQKGLSLVAYSSPPPQGDVVH